MLDPVIFQGGNMTMRNIFKTLAVAGSIGRAANSGAVAQDKPEILTSVPGLTFPFFVHLLEGTSKNCARSDGGADIGPE